MVVVDGVSLHYTDTGDGPPVVFLHGAKGSVYDAALSLGPELARDHRLVAFDRPGAGYSGRAGADSGSPLRPGRDCCTSPCASSTSCAPSWWRTRPERPVALALALEHPEDVAAVVTLGGYLFSARDAARAPNRLLLLPVVGAAPALDGDRASRAPAGGTRSCATSSFPDPSDPAYARLASGLALRPARLAGDARDLPAVEAGLRSLARRYADLETPVVAVHGLADVVVSAAQAVRLCQLVPRCDLVLLEEDGHMPHFTRPDDVLEAVALAWRRAGVAAGPRPPPRLRRLTPAAYTPPLVALGGEPAVPCTRNPLQRG